ncbi:MAG: hypothetical protein HKN33_14750 [Pyrinomonadaceae bacterium]|nr:hypothetical protein [Pyrinomonadaceae bacterium]
MPLKLSRIDFANEDFYLIDGNNPVIMVKKHGSYVPGVKEYDLPTALAGLGGSW